MKLARFILTVSLVFSTFCVEANWGCNLGNQIYPNATGSNNVYGDPKYYNSNPIDIRWWDQDPKCGIRDNKIYPRTNGDDNCEVNGMSWGVIYYFNPADNNCIPLPLDDYVWVMISGVGLVGYFVIKKKLIFS